MRIFIITFRIIRTGKGKVQPTTDHEGPGGWEKYLYSSLISALNGGGL
jgi:hypothetical protein